MTDVEKMNYRKQFPHVAPEVAAGCKPTTSSDVYSFGYIYSLSMISLDKSLGQLKKLLCLGKQLAHYHQTQRPDLTSALKQITECNTCIL